MKAIHAKTSWIVGAPLQSNALGVFFLKIEGLETCKTTNAAAAQAPASLTLRAIAGVARNGTARKCHALIRALNLRISRRPPPHRQRRKHRQNQRQCASDHGE
jgi:hypothetical protein